MRVGTTGGDPLTVYAWAIENHGQQAERYERHGRRERRSAMACYEQQKRPEQEGRLYGHQYANYQTGKNKSLSFQQEPRNGDDGKQQYVDLAEHQPMPQSSKTECPCQPDRSGMLAICPKQHPDHQGIGDKRCDDESGESCCRLNPSEAMQERQRCGGVQVGAIGADPCAHARHDIRMYDVRVQATFQCAASSDERRKIPKTLRGPSQGCDANECTEREGNDGGQRSHAIEYSTEYAPSSGPRIGKSY